MTPPFCTERARARVRHGVFCMIAAAAAPPASAGPVYAPIVWQPAPSKLVVGAHTVTNVGDCDGCGTPIVGAELIASGDASLQFTASTEQRLIVGLLPDGADPADFRSMPYALGVWPDGGWDVREHHVYKTEGRTNAGDVFSIALEGDSVRYYQNGDLVYSSARTPGAILRVTAILFTPGGSLIDARLSAMASQPVPLEYAASTDRVTHVEPPLPVWGPAGSQMADPTFGTIIHRVTDGVTRPGLLNLSFRTPSGTHSREWSADSRSFYVVSNDGQVIPFAFDPASGTASRIRPSSTDEGGLTLRFYIEPHYSLNMPGHMFGATGWARRTIDEYDLNTDTYTHLLNLDDVMPDLADTYVGGVSSGGKPNERILAFFGGESQDLHHYVVVFDRNDPASRHLLDTRASTFDGVPVATTLGFNLHHASIDQSGRFVILYPPWPDLAPPRSAAQEYVWDLATNVITPMTIDAHPYGHDAWGFGAGVNQDCCVTTGWDAAQWQVRPSLEAPTVSRDAILPVLEPKEIIMADHSSWHNAQPGLLVPFISGIFRCCNNTVEWRPWDNEIVAIETGMAPGVGARVWRLAHHRSDVSYDGNPAGAFFWAMPRPNVSPDGRWVLFTSNWGKALGLDSGPSPGGAYRQDVFLLELK